VKIQREPLSRPPYYVSQTQLQLRAARLAQRWYGGIGSGDSSTPENEGVSFEKPKKKITASKRCSRRPESPAGAVVTDSFVYLFTVKFRKQGWPQRNSPAKNAIQAVCTHTW